MFSAADLDIFWKGEGHFKNLRISKPLSLVGKRFIWWVENLKTGELQMFQPNLAMTFEGASAQCVYSALRKVVNPSSIRIRTYKDDAKEQQYAYLSFRDEIIAAAFPEYVYSDIRVDSGKVIKITINTSYKRGTDLDRSTFKNQTGIRTQAIKNESQKICNNGEHVEAAYRCDPIMPKGVISFCKTCLRQGSLPRDTVIAARFGPEALPRISGL